MYEFDETLQRIAKAAVGRTEPKWADLDVIDPFQSSFWLEHSDPPELREGKPTLKEKAATLRDISSELTPGSSASFRAADEASMVAYQSWKKKYGGGETGDLSGFVPVEDMVEVAPGHYLMPAAGKNLKAMIRAARKDGINIAYTDTYRSYDAQVATKEAKGAYAATPGHSNHGWGLAVDFNVNDPQVKAWMDSNAHRYGWENPEWARDGKGIEEPWHWEYTGGGDAHKTPKSPKRPPRRDKPDAPSYMKDPVQGLTTNIPLVMLAAMDETDEGGHYYDPEKRRPTHKVKGSKWLKQAPRELRQLFVEAADKFNVPLGLLITVAQKESGFNTEAVSSAGAQGVMQIMPLHGLENPFDPKENIFYGAQLLAGYIKQMGSLRDGLAAYNAGPNNHQAGLDYAEMVLQAWRGN